MRSSAGVWVLVLPSSFVGLVRLLFCRKSVHNIRYGIADSADHPTHFIAINLNSPITIIEIPSGNPSKARIYSGPTLYSSDGNSTPVTLEFNDVNGDGKIDMIVHIGDQSITYLNDGTQFKPQQEANFKEHK
jgi:hypothetical protein